MKTVVILNPNAGTAEKAAAIADSLRRRPNTALQETTQAGQARRFAAQAVADGAELVVAAGGDGTVNEVINGLAPDFHKVIFGLLPMGTGNDLSRLLALPDDPVEALAMLDTGRVEPFDLIRVESSARNAWCINVAAGGFSGQMNEILTDDIKDTWGPLAYVRGAAAVLPDLTNYQTYLAIDDEPPERVEALNIVVANGRTAAGGIQVAPDADPQDGLMDIVIIRNGSALQLAGIAARLVAGNLLGSELVLHRRARRARIDSRPGMWFNVDGELLTNEPIRFEVAPAALRVIAGEKFKATESSTPAD